MSTSYIITNTWTHAQRGHARDELRTIKQLLMTFSIRTQIVSVHSEFGDVNARSLGVTLHRMKLDHLRLFKPFVDFQISRDLSRCIKKGIRLAQPSLSTIVITSSRVNHLMELEKLLTGQNRPRIRILNSPNSSFEWESFANFIGRISIAPVIAMEVESSVIESRKYLGGVIHTPSHYGLQREVSSLNAARKEVGIFWPIGRNVSFGDVKSILNKTRFLNPIVKLPASVDMNRFKKVYPSMTFIPKETNDLEFRTYLSNIKVALLAHKNYTRQSSGYAGYFLANNVPIITSKTNSFFTELEKFGDFHAIEDYEEDLSDFLAYLEDKPLSVNRNFYNRFVIDSWKSFLL